MYPLYERGVGVGVVGVTGVEEEETEEEVDVGLLQPTGLKE